MAGMRASGFTVLAARWHYDSTAGARNLDGLLEDGNGLRWLWDYCVHREGFDVNLQLKRDLCVLRTQQLAPGTYTLASWLPCLDNHMTITCGHGRGEGEGEGARAGGL